jgi:hypothetical protein
VKITLGLIISEKAIAIFIFLEMSPKIDKLFYGSKTSISFPPFSIGGNLAPASTIKVKALFVSF